MTTTADLSDCPEIIVEFVTRALDAVRANTGVSLEFDSDTLPLLDHFVREVPSTSAEAAALIAAMVGAYFGETVRQQLNGTWKVETNDPEQWRLVLPGGLSFAPVPMALSAILKDESGSGNPNFQAPVSIMAQFNDMLSVMGSVTTYEYFTLSCRYDTLEHLQETLLAMAAAKAKSSPSGGG